MWVIVTILIIVFGVPFGLFFFSEGERGNIAVIDIHGVITTGDSSSFNEEGTSSSDVVDFIEKATNNPSIEAIVLDINSPGGSAVASDEIAQALRQTNKTTVSIIHEIGTSGAYWVASATDMSIASRMSITGSIGVIGSYLDFSELMDKYGVNYQRLVAGKYKDMGTPYKNLSDEERTIFQVKLDKLHSYFIDEIAKNRNISREKVRALATGEFFLGQEALDKGLIDKVGDKKTVDEYLKEKLNLKEVRYIHYQHERSILDILARISSEQFFFIGKGIGTMLASKTYRNQLVSV